MSQHDNTIYRRGVVLGLTMAEIVILVIFCLLLLFNVIVNKKNSEIKKIKEEIITKDKKIQTLTNNQPSLIENLERIYNELNKNSFDDAFKELLLIKKQVSDLKKNNEILTSKINSLNEVDELIKNFDLSAKEIADTIFISKILEEEISCLSENKTFKDIPSIIKSLKQDIQDYKNREKFLQRKCRGTEKPACWVDSSGKPEYIFQIALTSNGIILHNNHLNHRIEQQINLPIKDIEFDKELNSDQFLSYTENLFKWSKKNDCRFFVKVIDNTNSDEKKIYKKRLRTVEEHFYKYESVNNISDWIKNIKTIKSVELEPLAKDNS